MTSWLILQDTTEGAASSPFWQSIVLLVIGGLFTLIAEQVRRLLSRERRVVSWSLDTEPLVTADQSLPHVVKESIPGSQPVNVSRLRLAAINSGNRSVENTKLIVVAKHDTEIIESSASTKPPHGVPHFKETSAPDDQVVYSNLALRRDQQFHLELYAKSAFKPEVEVYWEGGDNEPSYIEKSTRAVPSIERHAIGILTNLIIAIAIPRIASSLGFLLSSGLRPLTDYYYIAPDLAIGTFTLLGNLLALLFYLRVVPHALALIQTFGSRRGQVGI